MDLAYFYANEGEDLNLKSQILEDFMRAAEDKCFCMNDLYLKYEKLESFLKHNEPFTQQCMESKHKSNFTLDFLPNLQEFVAKLE